MAHNSHVNLLLIVLFAIVLHCVVAERPADMELETQLKILNKPPIKTIQTKIGDIFDCIDINKQPSLDHPLLKNHVIKIRPIPHSINTLVNVDDHDQTDVSSSTSSSFSMKSSSRIAMLSKLDCPNGTVPIRRTSKEDLIRSQSFNKISISVGDDLETSKPKDQFLTVVKTRKDSGIDYMGIQARLSINNPSAIGDQISTSQLWIENGSEEDEINTLQAGWMVAPALFGDYKTRLFGKWQVYGSNKSEGCYNIFCSGFVQVDKNYPVGTDIGPISEYGGKQYTTRTSISLDGGGNWWLEVEDSKIGYWPDELGLSKLTQGSSLIAWGGLAAHGVLTTTLPPTGNGHFPYTFLNYKCQCFMIQMKVMPVKTLHWEDPTFKIIEGFATKPKCSTIKYYGYRPFGFGHTLAFGGPGGIIKLNY